MLQCIKVSSKSRTRVYSELFKVINGYSPSLFWREEGWFGLFYLLCFPMVEDCVWIQSWRELIEWKLLVLIIIVVVFCIVDFWTKEGRLDRFSAAFPFLVPAGIVIHQISGLICVLIVLALTRRPKSYSFIFRWSGSWGTSNWPSTTTSISSWSARLFQLEGLFFSCLCFLPITIWSIHRRAWRASW
jgi:hypothetical protein